MLQRSLYEVGIGALLANRGMGELLRSNIVRGGVTDSAELTPSVLRDKCRECIQDELDRDWPRRFRLNELERIAALMCGNGFFERGEVRELDRTCDELLRFDGDRIFYRVDRVQAYARLSVEVDPAVIVTWHIAERVARDPALGSQAVLNLVEWQEAFFAPPASEGSLAVAENHAHLGGISGEGLVLAQHVLGLVGLDELREAPRIQRLKVVLHELVQIWSQPDLPVGGDWLASLTGAFHDESTVMMTEVRDWRTVVDGLHVRDVVDTPWLLRRLASAVAHGEVSNGWHWLFLMLWRCFRDRKSPMLLRVCVYFMISELMCLRRDLVMSGQGLRRFAQDYYRAPLRSNSTRGDAGERAASRDVVRRVLGSSLDVAELKFGPTNFGPEVLSRFARASVAPDSIPAGTGLLAPSVTQAHEKELRNRLERWHFCVHLIRMNAKGSRRDARAPRRDELWLEADELVCSAGRRSGWNDDVFLGGFGNPSHVFCPDRWLRGLDVAGDETAWPIECFAPQLRWLREALPALPHLTAPRRGPHFSIHAGEDYSHPLSGMRHVDETVRFCALREGDRLGHGLALGIRPLDWLSRHGEVLLPVEEHVDNLVWAWHRGHDLVTRLPLVNQVLPRIERRIARLLPYVQWIRAIDSALLSSDSAMIVLLAGPFPTLDVLAGAWVLRRNCPRQFQKEAASTRMTSDKLLAAVPDWDELIAEVDRPSVGTRARVFLDRARWEAEASKEGCLVLVRGESGLPAEAFDEPLAAELADCSVLLHDHDSDQEVEFMEALQDHLLDCYDGQGLCIETNPSSNIYIARLENHAEHPIFRWSPPDESGMKPGGVCNRFGLRKGVMPVLINTDDQGIIPTTLRTEYHLIGAAAIERGYARDVVDAWLARIRLAGLDHFRRNHVPIFQEPTSR